MTVTTRITRRYLENKTKSDLAQMYIDLLDDSEKERKELVNCLRDVTVRLQEVDDADVSAGEHVGAYEAIGRARRLLERHGSA